MARGTETVTKIEAARRQLDQAIKLFFRREDSVSIHALVANAHRILTDIAQKRGIRNFKSKEWIRPEHYDEYIDILHKAPNFIKHGKSDMEATLEFNSEISPLLIFDSIQVLSQLKPPLRPASRIFYGWFINKYPHCFYMELFSDEFRSAVTALDPDDFDFLLGAITEGERVDPPQ